jgi:hypothetical protein
MQDINSDLSIKDALAREEKFFRTQPVCRSKLLFLFFSVFLFHNNGIPFLPLGISWSCSVLWDTTVSKEAESGMVVTEMSIVIQVIDVMI